MKSTPLIHLSLVLFASATFAAENCTNPADATFKKVSAKPETVLEVVAKDVAATPKCACPIVKAAIAGCQADEDLTGDIIAAALNSAPDEAAAIKACVPAAAHGKGTGKGKNVSTGKGTVPAPVALAEAPLEDDGWFDSLIYGAGGMGAAGYGGSYASSPASGGGSGVDLNPEEVIEVIEVVEVPRIIVIRPSTKS